MSDDDIAITMGVAPPDFVWERLVKAAATEPGVWFSAPLDPDEPDPWPTIRGHACGVLNPDRWPQGAGSIERYAFAERRGVLYVKLKAPEPSLFDFVGALDDTATDE